MSCVPERHAIEKSSFSASGRQQTPGVFEPTIAQLRRLSHMLSVHQETKYIQSFPEGRGIKVSLLSGQPSGSAPSETAFPRREGKPSTIWRGKPLLQASERRRSERGYCISFPNDQGLPRISSNR